MVKGKAMHKQQNLELTGCQLTNSEMESKSRRKFISGFSLMIGGTAAATLLSGTAISVAMAYTPDIKSTLNDGNIFNQLQLQLLKQICALVIPKTETLGAAEVDTHGFIDNQLFHCHNKSEQEKNVQLINLIESVSNKQFSKSFITLHFDKQFQLLTALDLGEKPFNQDQRSDFKSLKQLICFGYYTSEVGASQELRYDAVPGGYQGSIPYKNNEASWGSQGLFF